MLKISVNGVKKVMIRIKKKACNDVFVWVRATWENPSCIPSAQEGPSSSVGW